MYIHYNPNPKNKSANDCVIRAISLATNKSWDQAYIAVVTQGYLEKEVPTTNYVWENYLQLNNWRKYILDTCPDCTTVKQFLQTNRIGTYILCTGSHVVAAIDGNYYDAWDSGDEIVMYFFTKQRR